MTAMTDTKITRPVPDTPPAVINNYTVTDTERRPGYYEGQLNPQYGVVCADDRGTFIAWSVAWDPDYRGGSWVAYWGHYDLTRADARQIMADKARP